MKSLLRVVVVMAICASSLVGCATTVALTPAEDAINPACAGVVVRLPDTAGGFDRHETNAQGTGAWGSPSEALLYCGVPVPGPSTLPCYLVGDVYWLFDDSQAPNMIYTTYGRTPATKVIVNQQKASPGNVLYDLTSAIDATKPTGHQCTSVADTLD
jgi:Protein of unknown function (DUF3515)